MGLANGEKCAIIEGLHLGIRQGPELGKPVKSLVLNVQFYLWRVRTVL